MTENRSVIALRFSSLFSILPIIGMGGNELTTG